MSKVDVVTVKTGLRARATCREDLFNAILTGTLSEING